MSVESEEREKVIQFLIKKHEYTQEYNRRYYQEHKERLREQQRQYHQEHVEEKKARDRRHYQGHREEIRAQQHQYLQEHRDEVYAYIRQYNKEHKEETREHHRRYGQKHREEANEHHRQYHREHPEVMRNVARRRRALKAGSNGSFTEEEFRLLCEQYDNRCVYCREELPLVSDHVTPLSRGGGNSIDNIVPACKSCNSMKGAMTFDEFVKRLREVVERLRKVTK